jgi:hypothetical protein
VEGLRYFRCVSIAHGPEHLGRILRAIRSLIDGLCMQNNGIGRYSRGAQALRLQVSYIRLADASNV